MGPACHDDSSLLLLSLRSSITPGEERTPQARDGLAAFPCDYADSLEATFLAQH